MTTIDLGLEFEYDLIEENNSNIISSNDIQSDIFNLFELSNNLYLYTLNFKQILNEHDALIAYREFETLAKNIFQSINGHNEYLKLMASLIKCMRHEHGLNKRLLSYCLLDILSEHDSQLANEVFLYFISYVGCWKDLKYFYSFSRDMGKEYNSSIIEYSIELANQQLKTDLFNFPNNLSNVAKWIPREKTKYNKLYERLVLNYFNEYKQTKKSMNKAKMQYRKNLSLLNKQLDTVQIKQCSQQWQKINPTIQTCRTMQLQINSFLNLSKNSNKMKYELSNRIICSQNFIDYNENNKNQNENKSENKSKREKIKINNLNDLFNIISKYSNSEFYDKNIKKICL